MKKYMIIEAQVGECRFVVRNADDTISLNDDFYGAKVIKLEAYGKEHDFIGSGQTAIVTFDKPPLMTLYSRMVSEWVDPQFTLKEADQLVEVLEAAARADRKKEEELRRLIYKIQVTEAYVKGHVY